MNGEYAGFFDIGMVQRNEANAIIVHGTMCLIRRARARSRGRLVERHHLRGYRPRPDACWNTAGSPITPATVTATACCPTPSRPTSASATAGRLGGFQIVRKHWRRFLPGASLLTARPEARIRASAGSTGWERRRVGVLVAILNLIWVPIVAFVGIAIPDKVLTLPILATFAISIVQFRRALPPSRADPGRPDGRRHVGGDGDAMDGGARGRQRHLQGPPRLRAHREGRPLERCRAPTPATLLLRLR